MPLGGLQSEFLAHDVRLASGDTLLLFSDGLAEQPDSDGGPVGYDFVRDGFARALADAERETADGGSKDGNKDGSNEVGDSAVGDSAVGDSTDQERASLDRVMASLEHGIEELTGGDAPADDISLLLIRIR